MKKIFSVILALVLVLAIAAPAMAITGYVSPVVEKNVAAPFNVDVALISTPAAGLDVLKINTIAANKAYIVNEIVYGAISVTYDSKTNWDKYDTENTQLILSSNAIDIIEMIPYQIDSVASTVLLGGGAGNVTQASGAVTIDNTNNCAKWTVQDYRNYVVLFSGVAKAQGSIVAELRGGNQEYFAGVKGQLSTARYPIFNDVGDKLYEMWETADGIFVESFIKDATGIVRFEMNGDVYCDNIYVEGNKISYSIPVSNEGAVLESIGTYTEKDAEFKALKACYENVMTYFGFDYNTKGELLDAHFTSKLHSFYDVDTVAVNFYSDVITIPGADVDIPQTGDAATTIGFVMVAMAIVAAAAAAAVAYKKVRN